MERRKVHEMFEAKMRIVYLLEERKAGVSKIASGTNLPALPREAGSSHTSGCYGSVAFSGCLVNFLVM